MGQGGGVAGEGWEMDRGMRRTAGELVREWRKEKSWCGRCGKRNGDKHQERGGERGEEGGQEGGEREGGSEAG